MLLLGLLIILMLGQNTMIEQMTDGDRYSCSYQNMDWQWKGDQYKRYECKKNEHGKYHSQADCNTRCNLYKGDS